MRTIIPFLQRGVVNVKVWFSTAENVDEKILLEVIIIAWYICSIFLGERQIEPQTLKTSTSPLEAAHRKKPIFCAYRNTERRWSTVQDYWKSWKISHATTTHKDATDDSFENFWTFIWLSPFSQPTVFPHYFLHRSCRVGAMPKILNSSGTF